MVRIATAMLAFVLMTVLAPIEATASVAGKPFTATGCDEYSDSVARLYTAGLDREPEQGGFEFWIGEYTAGRWDLPRMATFFTQSDEFIDSYGELTDDGFIRQLYRNMLDREGDAGGITFWNQQMTEGMTRGTVLLRFAESPENIALSGTVPPALGAFNEGLDRPWDCANPTNSSPSNPLPLTTNFTEDNLFDNIVFAGQFLHVVEGTPSFGSESGRCIFVLGTFTPTQLEQGNASPSFNRPSISLIVDDTEVQASVSNCERMAFEDVGWGWSSAMSVTVGTGYAFFEEFFLPSSGGRDPQAIVLGDTTTSNARYFQADVSQGIPSPPATTSGPNTFFDNSPGIGAFTTTGSSGSVTWDGRIVDVVDAPVQDVAGTCFVVLGELTPTENDNDGLTAFVDQPAINLLGSGRVLTPGQGRCVTDAVEGAGYESIFDAELAVAEQYDFYAAFFIPEIQTIDLQAVIVGQASTDEALYFTP